MSVSEAASELGIHRQTLSSRLKTAGIGPGLDDKYSIRDLLNAMTGGHWEAERLLKIRAERELFPI